MSISSAQYDLDAFCVLITGQFRATKFSNIGPGTRLQEPDEYVWLHGRVGKSPDIDCVYQNDAARTYTSIPGAVAPAQETENFWVNGANTMAQHSTL